MEQALTQLDVKILFDDFTYHANICNALWSLKLSDSFTIFGLWVLGLAVSNINESQLQTYES